MDALYYSEPHRDALLAIGGQHRHCLCTFGQGDSLGLKFVRTGWIQWRFGLVCAIEHRQLAVEPRGISIFAMVLNVDFRTFGSCNQLK